MVRKKVEGFGKFDKSHWIIQLNKQYQFKFLILLYYYYIDSIDLDTCIWVEYEVYWMKMK